MPIVDGSAPDLSFFYNKTEVSSEILASSASWTQYLEQTNLYSDAALTHQVGYKIQNSTNGLETYQYQGTLTFGNEIGSITFVNGDDNATRDPNVGQVYVDRIAGGKKHFILAEGVIATVYPLEGDVVALYVYLSKDEVVDVADAEVEEEVAVVVEDEVADAEVEDEAADVEESAADEAAAVEDEVAVVDTEVEDAVEDALVGEDAVVAEDAAGDIAEDAAEDASVVDEVAVVVEEEVAVVEPDTPEDVSAAIVG